jgi:hypothetical protein
VQRHRCLHAATLAATAAISMWCCTYVWAGSICAFACSLAAAAGYLPDCTAFASLSDWCGPCASGSSSSQGTGRRHVQVCAGSSTSSCPSVSCGASRRTLPIAAAAAADTGAATDIPVVHPAVAARDNCNGHGSNCVSCGWTPPPPPTLPACRCAEGGHLRPPDSLVCSCCAHPLTPTHPPHTPPTRPTSPCSCARRRTAG